MNESPISGIHWLSDKDYDKAVTQLRLSLNGVFRIFAMYGQDVHIPRAVLEASKLAEDFGLRVRGIDQPITLEKVIRMEKK